MWVELIRAYCAHHKIVRISINGYPRVTNGSSSTTPSTPATNSPNRDSQLIHQLFRNDSIDRQLTPDAIRMLLDHLASDSYGVWEDVHAGSNRSTFLISPQHRFTEVGDIIWNHIERIGESTSIMTVYELQHGDSMKGTIFHTLDEHVILAALRTLETRRRCAIIPAAIVSEIGIKFLG